MDTIDFIYLGIGIATSASFAVIVKWLLFPLKTNTIVRYFNQQKFKQAIKYARKLINKNPGHYEAHYYLGKCHLIQNSDKQALEEFEHVNRIGLFSPDCPEVTFRESFAKLLRKAPEIIPPFPPQFDFRPPLC